MTAAQWISLLTVMALALLMASMGLQVRFADLVSAAQPVHRVALGLVANFLVVPAATVAVLHLFQAAPLVSAGFLILSVCPGAPIGPPAAKIAGGNVVWAIGMMVVLAGLSAVLSPALLSVLMSWLSSANDLKIDFLAIARALLVAQLLPLAVGLAVRHWLPVWSEKLGRPLNLLANVLLLVLVGLILATYFDMLASIQLRSWLGMTLLFAADLTIGWVFGGNDHAIRKSLALTTVARNAAVGLVIANNNFAGTPAMTAVVAYGLFSIVGALVFAAVWGRATKNR